MKREPWFWRDQSFSASITSAALSPLGAIYNLIQKLQWARTKPLKVRAPTICIGGVTLGGVGKTPFAILLCEQFRQRGLSAHIATRGYGGTANETLKVDPSVHDSKIVGDESLLHAVRTPTWIAKNRNLAVNAAINAGAEVVVLDDGFQNAATVKSFSFLLVDNADPVGNGRVFPAGPLREPLPQAMRRADACVAITRSPGETLNPLIMAESGDTPVVTARLELDRTVLPPSATAFCGIGAPHRFRESLETAGVSVKSFFPFANHHPYSSADITALRRASREAAAPLVTTEKDFVRLPPDWRQGITCVRAEMVIDDEAQMESLVTEAITRNLQSHA